MWKGRFTQPTSALVQRYGESVSFDWRLYEHDIRAREIPAGRRRAQARREGHPQGVR